MKKLILSALITLMLFLSTSVIYKDDTELEIIEVKAIPVEEVEVVEILPTPTPQPTPDPIEVALQDVERRMSNIETIEDEMEWFIAYKEIINDYEGILDSPESIYDVFSEEELDLLFRVVQAEVGDEWDFIHKTNVANVIFNRLYSEEDDFSKQDTLSKVLVARQFSTISSGRYKQVEISELTILACEYAFMIQDTTDGCIAFRSDKNAPNIWNGWTRMYHDGAHWLYKKLEKGE